ncbi:hypothetical protein IHN32_09880 [Deinococcus sp. 14RED07]|uniref:hypothetical protein n=1 Tax=Deinococcus sp. 14RED07 TaxID=2745874 RepID=UPI001E437DD2|nr:hypothetical protein [Deinococcus sp. 14RED07]MCD0176249.1 hypothetical protein [Deinococcus sp. 14RED07]
MHQHLTVSGHTAWTVTDRAGQIVASGDRHNLITNAGLDALANENGRDLSASQKAWTTWRQTLRVGTGSTPPTVTKTALGAEIAGATSSSVGGFDSEQSYAATQSGNVLTAVSVMVRVASFTAAANVTEYGLSATTNGQLSVTELFRDAQGNPVAVPVQAGYQLKLTHTFTLTLPFVAAAATVNVGTGDLSALTTFYATGASSSRFVDAVTAFAPGNGSDVYILSGADTGTPTTATAPVAVASTRTNMPYVAGSYSRVKRFEIGPADGTRDHYGWLFGNSTNGFKVALQNGAKVTKGSTQRLTLDLLLTWGRA